MEVVEKALERIAGARGVGRCQRAVAPGCRGRSCLGRGRGIGPSRRRREEDERKGEQQAKRAAASRVITHHISLPVQPAPSMRAAVFLIGEAARVSSRRHCRCGDIRASTVARAPGGWTHACGSRVDVGVPLGSCLLLPWRRAPGKWRGGGQPVFHTAREAGTGASGTLPAGGPRTSGGRPSRPPCS